MSFMLVVTIRSKFDERSATIQPMSNCALFMHRWEGQCIIIST